MVLSLDGVGAYDHIRRAEMLSKLQELPKASAMLPFVRMFYAAPSAYLWEHEDGTQHDITQGEGGEQGDAGRAAPQECKVPASFSRTAC